ncbi:binder of sperm protein homolog 2-like isoform X3 [Bos indicus]|uniref:Binder of sperm protein homolog 2-like isoform X3 n=1 Tax=Bos indicus TaxID=9915 RepID=A0ABM4QW02_BOSIN|nr:binder of sperm protein homolog 2-like isoform X2 [Bos javanicus]
MKWIRKCEASFKAVVLKLFRTLDSPGDLIFRIPRPFSVFSNYSCIFPFVYDDIVYYSCVSVRSDYAWCSIDEMFQGRWRYCTAKGGLFITEPAQKPLMWFNHLENSSVW